MTWALTQTPRQFMRLRDFVDWRCVQK